MANQISSDELALLRKRQVLRIVPISGSTLLRWVTAGRFPAPIKLSEKISVWRAADIVAWRVAHGDIESDTSPAPGKVQS